MKFSKIKNDVENRIKTFDFYFCFEFAMRTMGHHVARCSHNKNKVKSKTIVES